MRDESGALLMEYNGRKDRLTADREAAIVAAWKKHEPAADLPAELKVLDRMIGKWDLITDATGKVFVDMDSTLTRKK